MILAILKLTNQIRRSRSLRLPGFPLTRRATSARISPKAWPSMLSYGDLPPPDPRITDVSWKWPACTHFPFRYHHHHHHAVYHETQISFCIRRSVCTDCSDRSHPSHIGFVAGNRIHVHLCCYYRAIGVFVYWLTKSTDIESDNRHYFCPVPDPFSNPFSPSFPFVPLPPT